MIALICLFNLKKKTFSDCRILGNVFQKVYFLFAKVLRKGWEWHPLLPSKNFYNENKNFWQQRYNGQPDLSHTEYSTEN